MATVVPAMPSFVNVTTFPNYSTGTKAINVNDVLFLEDDLHFTKSTCSRTYVPPKTAVVVDSLFLNFAA